MDWTIWLGGLTLIGVYLLPAGIFLFWLLQLQFEQAARRRWERRMEYRFGILWKRLGRLPLDDAQAREALAVEQEVARLDKELCEEIA